MDKQSFLDYVKDFCLKNNIIFLTFPSNIAFTVVNNAECAGFFEENASCPPTLGIAEGLEPQLFYEVLAHELNHAHQFLEKSPYWTASRLTPEEVTKYSALSGKDVTGFETGDLFEMWLNKEIELPSEELEDIVDRTTGVEFDCETRTIDMAKKLGLSIDPEVYAQKANAYLITYYYALKTRRWTTTGMSAYTKPEVYSTFPTTVSQSFCKQISPEIIELISTHCISQCGI